MLPVVLAGQCGHVIMLSNGFPFQYGTVNGLLGIRVINAWGLEHIMEVRAFGALVWSRVRVA